jgi:hypothetical protein
MYYTPVDKKSDSPSKSVVMFAQDFKHYKMAACIKNGA